MFICPVCYKKFQTEELVKNHFMQCWKEQHPYHKSKDAPRSKNIETKEVNDDIMNFFEGLNNGRN